MDAEEVWARAVAFVLEEEGEHADDPHDPGGDTWYGISRAAYPALEPWPPTKETAIALYRRDYWEATRVAQLPPPLALAVFDAAVNMGRVRAVRLLQETLGVTIDGVIGPVTAAAAHAVEARRVLADYLTRRVLVYVALPGFPRYGRGWIGRCFRAQQAALALA
ncbi:MAG TPA: glycosyl hydrolase 108 family protein [Gaiellaceae bacterium]|nr:glycosyl hydrolase 108 family protein [Gaiellaceae bacterium]